MNNADEWNLVNIDTSVDSQWIYDKHKLADGSYNSDLSAYSDDGEIANTESFNYGPSKVKIQMLLSFTRNKHGMLDVDGTPEPATRSKQKNNFIQI